MTRHAVVALGAAALLALAVSPAASHITLETSDTKPNAPFKAVFRVTHGCDGEATTGIAIKIPEGIIAAKPMPKPGWSVDIVNGPYAKAYAFFHGTMLAKGATSISWKNGSLPDDMYDEFVIAAYVSDAFRPGDTVAIPVVQTCTAGKSLSWSEVPKPGQDVHALRTPAPLLHIVGEATSHRH